ncbi:hypothetical protein KKJ17_09995 [Xenorhabdus bovienii]|uniref:contractile injection system tape measure protein n=1 Tax=Xenorhabdus bovienii TaxID=40576 RepID=UPI0023B35618|nr:contractile injection system tape measure protein [Xenorhabdus bovienii]MDE9518062.1 hypothetical protein [Xenorhabdus bovienii]
MKIKIGKVIISIEIDKKTVAKEILNKPILNQNNIKNILASCFNHHVKNELLQLEKISLNLGKIYLNEFNFRFPIRLETSFLQELGKCFSHKENKIEYQQLPKINNYNPLRNVNDIDKYDFLSYLQSGLSLLCNEKIITKAEIVKTDVKHLINMLMDMNNNQISSLAIACLCGDGLQKINSIKKNALLIAINFILSEEQNTYLYEKDIIYPEQLILSALKYAQRNDIKNIPKPDQKIISYIATGISIGVLNLTSVMSLFYKFGTKDSLPDEWLEVFWKIKPVSQFCREFLSGKAYKSLVNCFGDKKLPFNEEHIQQMTPVDSMFSEILEMLAAGHEKNLPPLNQYKLSLIATAIQQKKIKTQNIIHLFQHPELYDEAGSTWLASLWQLMPVRWLCKELLSTEGYKNIFQRFFSYSINRNRSDIKLLMNAENYFDNKKYQDSLDKNNLFMNQQELSTLVNIKSNIFTKPKTIKIPHNNNELFMEKNFSYQINNAGILILWPMLPTLFKQFDLLDGGKFIHRHAQYRAVCFLNHLVWDDKNKQGSVLSNILCGLKIEDYATLPYLESAEKQRIEQWIEVIIHQISAWKKLTKNDVRQLFLQRHGELLIDEKGIKVSIQYQPFDVLLIDWPWPLNIAKLPWLDHLLFINWKGI